MKRARSVRSIGADAPGAPLVDVAGEHRDEEGGHEPADAGLSAGRATSPAPSMISTAPDATTIASLSSPVARGAQSGTTIR